MQLRWWLAAFWVLWMADVVLTVVVGLRLPDPAPLHVGIHGVDRWGSPTEFLVGELLALALLAFSGPGLVWLMPKVPMHMTSSTSPDYWKTPERFPAGIAHTNVFLMATMTAALGLALSATYGFWELAHERPYPQALSVAALILLAVVMVTGLVLVFRALRPPQWWKDCRHAHGHRWD